jgi:uncharacterized protein YbcI
MESNPAVLGGSLMSKPTWSNTSGCSATPAFLVLGCVRRYQSLLGGQAMEKLDPSVAEQIAQAAIAFQQQRTGHEPQSVAVVLSGDTLLITLHGALSPAEKTLSQSPEGAAQVQEFHRQLFANSADELRQEIKRDHRGRGARSDHGSRNDDGHRGAGVHDRHDGTGVPTRQGRAGEQLERERFTCSILREVQRRRLQSEAASDGLETIGECRRCAKRKDVLVKSHNDGHQSCW